MVVVAIDEADVVEHFRVMLVVSRENGIVVCAAEGIERIDVEDEVGLGRRARGEIVGDRAHGVQENVLALFARPEVRVVKRHVGVGDHFRLHRG